MTRARMTTITVVICLTTVLSHSIGRSVYSLLLSAIREDLDLTYTEAGAPSSGLFACYVVGVLAVVWFSPRVEPITIMRVAFVVASVGLVIAATAQDVVTLTIGVSLTGGAGAGVWMTAPVLATAYVSEHRRGLVIGLLTASIGLANIAFGFGTSALRRSADDDLLWRPIWWIALGFTLALLVALVGIARFDRTERVTARGLSLAIVRKVPRWQRLTLAYTLFGGTSAGFSSFIVEALEEHGGLSRSQSALTFSMMGLAGVIGAVLGGGLSDRLGRQVVMRTALVLLVLSSFLVAIGTPATAVAGALGYTAAASAFPTLIAATVRDTLDDRAFSQALAMMTIMFSLFAAIIPTVVGAIADATESFVWPYLALSVLPAAALVVLTVPDRSPQPAVTG